MWRFGGHGFRPLVPLGKSGFDQPRTPPLGPRRACSAGRSLCRCRPLPLQGQPTERGVSCSHRTCVGLGEVSGDRRATGLVQLWLRASLG